MTFHVIKTLLLLLLHTTRSNVTRSTVVLRYRTWRVNERIRRFRVQVPQGTSDSTVFRYGASALRNFKYGNVLDSLKYVAGK